jgi:hypothetical protein
MRVKWSQGAHHVSRTPSLLSMSLKSMKALRLPPATCARAAGAGTEYAVPRCHCAVTTRCHTDRWVVASNFVWHLQAGLDAGKVAQG